MNNNSIQVEHLLNRQFKQFEEFRKYLREERRNDSKLQDFKLFVSWKFLHLLSYANGLLQNGHGDLQTSSNHVDLSQDVLSNVEYFNWLLNKIKYLVISERRVDHISKPSNHIKLQNLKCFKKVDKLFLSKVPHTLNLSEIFNFTKLKHLTLSQQNTGSRGGRGQLILDKLFHTLSLDNNELSLLEELHLNSNRLKNANFLLKEREACSFAPNLRVLNLDDNEISDDGIINEIICKFPKLQTLSLKSNKFVREVNIRTQLLQSLKLQNLDLSYNEIEVMPGLENLTSLRRLDLSYNMFVSHSLLSGVSKMSHLQSLSVTGNPCSVLYDHRIRCASWLHRNVRVRAHVTTHDNATSHTSYGAIFLLDGLHLTSNERVVIGSMVMLKVINNSFLELSQYQDSDEVKTSENDEMDITLEKPSNSQLFTKNKMKSRGDVVVKSRSDSISTVGTNSWGGGAIGSKTNSTSHTKKIVMRREVKISQPTKYNDDERDELMRKKMFSEESFGEDSSVNNLKARVDKIHEMFDNKDWLLNSTRQFESDLRTIEKQKSMEKSKLKISPPTLKTNDSLSRQKAIDVDDFVCQSVAQMNHELVDKRVLIEKSNVDQSNLVHEMTAVNSVASKSTPNELSVYNTFVEGKNKEEDALVAHSDDDVFHPSSTAVPAIGLEMESSNTLFPTNEIEFEENDFLISDVQIRPSHFQAIETSDWSGYELPRCRLRVTICADYRNSDAAKTANFLSVGKKYEFIREEADSDGRVVVLREWNIDDVDICEVLKRDENSSILHISFRSMNNNANRKSKERTYVMKLVDMKGLLEILEPVLESQRMSVDDLVVLRCIKCQSEFTEEVKSNVEGLRCRNCGSQMLLQLEKIESFKSHQSQLKVNPINSKHEFPSKLRSKSGLLDKIVLKNKIVVEDTDEERQFVKEIGGSSTPKLPEDESIPHIFPNELSAKLKSECDKLSTEDENSLKSREKMPEEGKNEIENQNQKSTVQYKQDSGRDSQNSGKTERSDSSDISVLSNPSQSSIEVLKQSHQQQKQDDDLDFIPSMNRGYNTSTTTTTSSSVMMDSGNSDQTLAQKSSITTLTSDNDMDHQITSNTIIDASSSSTTVIPPIPEIRIEPRPSTTDIYDEYSVDETTGTSFMSCVSHITSTTATTANDTQSVGVVVLSQNRDETVSENEAQNAVQSMKLTSSADQSTLVDDPPSDSDDGLNLEWPDHISSVFCHTSSIHTTFTPASVMRNEFNSSCKVGVSWNFLDYSKIDHNLKLFCDLNVCGVTDPDENVEMITKVHFRLNGISPHLFRDGSSLSENLREVVFVVSNLNVHWIFKKRKQRHPKNTGSVQINNNSDSQYELAREVGDPCEWLILNEDQLGSANLLNTSTMGGLNGAGGNTVNSIIASPYSPSALLHSSFVGSGAALKPLIPTSFPLTSLSRISMLIGSLGCVLHFGSNVSTLLYFGDKSMNQAFLDALTRVIQQNISPSVSNDDFRGLKPRHGLRHEQEQSLLSHLKSHVNISESVGACSVSRTGGGGGDVDENLADEVYEALDFDDNDIESKFGFISQGVFKIRTDHKERNTQKHDGIIENMLSTILLTSNELCITQDFIQFYYCCCKNLLTTVNTSQIDVKSLQIFHRLYIKNITDIAFFDDCLEKVVISSNPPVDPSNNGRFFQTANNKFETDPEKKNDTQVIKLVLLFKTEFTLHRFIEGLDVAWSHIMSTSSDSSSMLFEELLSFHLKCKRQVLKLNELREEKKKKKEKNCSESEGENKSSLNSPRVDSPLSDWINVVKNHS